MEQLPSNWREQLSDLRSTLYRLHKALVDGERQRYEAEHGPIASNGQYLQLLINDPRFTWLQPYTKLVVGIDETIDSKEAVTLIQVNNHWVQARTLTMGEINTEASKYSVAHEASPAVQDQHAILMAILRNGYR
jgi:hypothetical protein